MDSVSWQHFKSIHWIHCMFWGMKEFKYNTITTQLIKSLYKRRYKQVLTNRYYSYTRASWQIKNTLILHDQFDVYLHTIFYDKLLRKLLMACIINVHIHISCELLKPKVYLPRCGWFNDEKRKTTLNLDLLVYTVDDISKKIGCTET